MDSEGAAMYDAAVALRDAMIELEVAVDGGKDSLSMAAAAGEQDSLWLWPGPAAVLKDGWNH